MAELKEMYQIFTECWRFYKRYSEREKTDAIWREEIPAEVRRIGNAHAGAFAKHLVLLVMEQLKEESGYPRVDMSSWKRKEVP